MKIKDAEKITHSLSKPGKMPGYAYSTPAHECKTGTKLRAVKGSVCFNCYAYERGRYRFQNVKDAQYKRLEAIKHPLWARAMAVQINSKKVKYFRWHDSGDVQNPEHLQKIFEVCKLTPDIKHWMPTREAWTKDYLEECPENLIIRFSAPMLAQAAPASWPWTSTVVTSGRPCSPCTGCPGPVPGTSSRQLLLLLLMSTAMTPAPPGRSLAR